MTRYWAYALFVFVAGCSDTRQTAENPNQLKADQYITLDSSAYGCEYPSKFASALEHRNRNELNAWVDIVNDEPYCFYAGRFKTPQHWVILQIRGSAMQIGVAGNADYNSLIRHSEKFRSNSNPKFWTLAMWGEKYAETITEFQEKKAAEPLSSQPTSSVPLTGRFAIQIASMTSDEKVEELQSRLRSAGVVSYTQKLEFEGVLRTRVRVGPFDTKSHAEATRARLNKMGLAGTLIPL